MIHTPIQNGDGCYCARCGQAWDRDEQPPATCVTTAPADSSFLNGGPATEPRRVIVALCGEKSAGKDTAAAPLIERGFTNVKMADGLKIMLRAFLAYRGVDTAMVDRMIDGDLKEAPSRFLNGRSPRHAMQTLGDWGRNQMQTDLWLAATCDRLDQVGDAVITDVRYANEAARVRGLGARLYRIERAGQGGSDTHSSETEVRHLRVDAVLQNVAVSGEAFQAQVMERFLADGVLT